MITIRKATEEDVPDILSCCVAAFKDYILLIGQTPGPLREDYWEACRNHHLFVATEGDDIAGVLLVKDGEGDVMWLDVLATDPAQRGKGIGKALILYAEDFIRSQGKGECRLYTHVKYEKTAAIYRHMDYEEYDRVKEYGFERFYMKKKL